MARTVVTVAADRAGGWRTSTRGAPSRGGGRSGDSYPTKDKAVKAAVRQAKAAELGQVIVKGRDGRIQYEWTYGQDPRRRRG